MSEPKFPELPVEVQVALINAATNIASEKIKAMGKDFNDKRDWFKTEYHKICDTLYTENRGR
ncbi:hypothetical protein [Enterobacter hormaechei]|uniref:hypothetical protein n=1 Tax=Enterobacter hormaechei TaxID=158836 RepID=UPI000E306B0B|nr:hypothetical protein [Enterobacter hormaechei]RFF35226.1 hypothetical protein DZ701_07275 [Enterobacter hormaechei]RFF35285.1 hypothetical protein DZ701_07605 [Enterobacter hormaechei]